MDWRSVSFDWNQTRAFLVTAEEGSLSAAARALGSTQPTLGRQVSALEQSLGVMLFERAGRSLMLTSAGLELLEHVRAMGDAANRISLAASGQAQEIEGKVAITATDMMSAYYLPPVLKRLRDEAPGIEIEVVASNEVRDLQRREADIAIRHARPEQPDLIARLVRETVGHLYAHPAYLDRLGRPLTMERVSEAVFINYDRSDRLMHALNGFGLSLTEKNFKLITNTGIAGWEMVKLGLGIGAGPREMADLTPGVESVFADQIAFPVPIWIVTHRELRTSRRIRLVFDLLADSFA